MMIRYARIKGGDGCRVGAAQGQSGGVLEAEWCRPE
jgi:hypothetical protein